MSSRGSSLTDDDLEGGLYCQKESVKPVDEECIILPLTTLENKTILATSTSSLKDEDEQSPFMILPNPANDKVEIELLGSQVISKLTIYDTSGKVVQIEHEVDYGKGINLMNLSSGVYLFRIDTKTSSYVHKLIKL